MGNLCYLTLKDKSCNSREASRRRENTYFLFTLESLAAEATESVQKSQRV